MPISFSQSLRALAADGNRRAIGLLLLAVLVLGAWGVWFVGARVAVYEQTDKARLEVDRTTYPVEVEVGGRVIESHLALDREVQVGEVLVTLDGREQELQLGEASAQLVALRARHDALAAQIVAEEQGRGERAQGGRAAHSEAQARSREVQAAALLAEDEVARLEGQVERGAVPEVELARARATAKGRRAAADAADQEVRRLEWDRRSGDSGGRADIERIRADMAAVDGEIATLSTRRERLAHDLERRVVRAPVGGRIGEVTPLQVGAVVAAGERLAVIVPPGELRVVAWFTPSAALGRIRPGQAAQLHLEGFPSIQYGTVAARVDRIAAEPRDGLVRVELAVRPGDAHDIPLQHGMPGTVEVRVDLASPATLVLRAAGQLIRGRRVD